MNRRKALMALVMVIFLLVFSLTFAFDKKKPPSEDFVMGFEAGVRYGILVYLDNPKEDNLEKITEEAKKWYWIIVVDEGKSLMKGGVK